MSNENLQKAKELALGLNTDELRNLSSFLGECYKSQERAVTLANKAKMSVGGKVALKYKGEMITGEVIKIRQTKALVRGNDGINYNVPMSTLLVVPQEV